MHKAERPQASARLQPAVPNQASQAVAAATSTSSHGKLTARRLLRKASEAAEAAETSSTAHDRSVPQSAVHAADGESSLPSCFGMEVGTQVDGVCSAHNASSKQTSSLLLGARDSLTRPTHGV